MNNPKEYYQWSKKDKGLYVLSLIPFILSIAGTLYLLHDYSIIITLIWIILYISVNIFQAGCCVGCPYRGKYCPAFVGVYLGNFLSTVIYKKRQFDLAFHKKNVIGGEITVTIFLLFPLYWIIQTHWYYGGIYLALIVLHILLFMPSQCPKCSYNNTCPGGQAFRTYSKWFKRKET